jgi:hypothetical protein
VPNGGDGAPHPAPPLAGHLLKHIVHAACSGSSGTSQVAPGKSLQRFAPPAGPPLQHMPFGSSGSQTQLPFPHRRLAKHLKLLTAVCALAFATNTAKQQAEQRRAAAKPLSPACLMFDLPFQRRVQGNKQF